MPGLSLLIVATWYPGVDDPVRGRFVADQAQALVASGRVRPLVASFDVALVEGDDDSRRRQVAAIRAHPLAATRTRPDVINPHGWGGYAGVGVARLPVAENVGPVLPGGHEAELRLEALEPVLERVTGAGDRVVVHAHTGYPDGYVGAAISKRFGWPLVVTEHASFVARQLAKPGQRERYLETARTASRFVAVSEVLAAELRQAIPDLGERLVVIPNVIPLDAFTPTGLDGRRPEELLFVGYRKERKGMVTLLRAFAELREQRPGATLRLVGRSNTEAEEQRWIELADYLEVADAVSFDPPADRAGVAEAMARAGLFVHPSPRETFGITTLEALASGLPVVATRSGGISAILEDSRLGELVPSGDPHLLARAVLRALERRADFDPAVLRAAVAPFSADAVAARLVDLYEEVLAEAGPQVRHPAAAERPLSWSGGEVQPLGDPVVVIGIDTAHAARAVASMDPALRARLLLLTHGGPALAQMPDGLGELVSAEREVDAELSRLGMIGPRGSGRARLTKALLHPIATVRRQLLRGRSREVRRQAASAVLGQALNPWSAGSERSVPEVVCLKGPDYLIAQPHLEAGRLRPVPGGIGWLGDRWASAQASSSPSRERTSEAIRSPTTFQS